MYLFYTLKSPHNLSHQKSGDLNFDLNYIPFITVLEWQFFYKLLIVAFSVFLFSSFDQFLKFCIVLMPLKFVLVYI